MIIDQLPLLSGDLQSTDEIPIERGTTTYKTTVDKITVPTDATPTQGSTNPVQSGGVYTALQTKQNALTFDSSPTQGSSNPVTSGGIYDALRNVSPTGLVSYAEAQTLTAAQQTQARSNIGANWVLLWENASPTSSFAAQTISVDLSGYAFLLVDANRVGSANDYSAIIAPNLVNYKFLLGAVIGLETQYFTNRYRFFTIVSGGLQVGAGQANDSATANQSYIPWHIYGIKG